jgi:hypothetical protein
MNKNQTSDFALGIIGNLLASVIIAVANILFGRFIPNAPRDVLDVGSSVLPVVIIILFLYRDKIRKIRIEPRLWLLRLRKTITQTPLAVQIKQFFYSVANGIRQFLLRLSEMRLQTKNWKIYLEKAIKPSVIIVTVITVFLIVSFGVSIRWLFERRIETASQPVYSSYQQIYDFLAPQSNTP